jgi:hypothetical protein
VVYYTRPTATDFNGAAVPVTCTPVTGTRFAVGQTAVTCTATDSAGNTATAVFTVWVQYQVAADSKTSTIFQQPINPDGSSVFRLTSVIPVEFKLSGASASIKNLAAHIKVVKTSDTVVGSVNEKLCVLRADSGDLFRYDTGSKEYRFNYDTRPLTQGTYRIEADLGDGVTRTVKVTLKK